MTSSIHVRRLRNEVSHTAARFVDYATRHGVPATELPSVKLPWFEIRSAGECEYDDSDPEFTEAVEEPGDTAEIFIFDEIGGSFGIDANDFVEALNGITAANIKLRINSPGGSVFDGLTIANALRHHPARVTAYVDGLAASAASFVATAAEAVVMMPGAQMMIHDALATEKGNAEDHRHMATFLDRQSDNIADLYMLKAGKDRAHWRELMDAETWLFAMEAVEFGLADRVYRDETARVQARMARSFDLSGFRYAGRAAAPKPGSQSRTARRTHQRAAGGATMTTTAAPTDLASAARARSTAFGATGATRAGVLPQETGQARLVPTGARLKAQLTERNGQQQYHLDGMASVTDRRYRMWDTFGEYDEVVTRAAFDATLAANPDVAFLINHKGMTLARTQAGTLQLSMTPEGLRSQAWLNPKRTDVQDLVLAVEDGNITEMSFAFMLEDGVWDEDFTTFRITQLSLDRGDVSAVNYGANPYTSIAARSREILADLDRLPAGLARAAMDRLTARGDMPSSAQAAAGTSVTVSAGGAVTVTSNVAPATSTSAAPSAEPVKADLTSQADISFYETLLDLT